MPVRRKVVAGLVITGVAVAVLGTGAIVGKQKYDAYEREPEQVYVKHVKANSDVGGNTSTSLIAGGRAVCQMFYTGKTEKDVDKAMAFEDFPDDLAAATKKYAVQDLCPEYLPKLQAIG